MFNIDLDDLEYLSKAIDPKDLKLFISHTKMMNNNAAKMADRVKAAEAVFKMGILHSKNNPKEKPLKTLAAEFTPELGAEEPNLEFPVIPLPVKSTAAPGVGIPFHEEFASHHGGDPTKLKSAFEAMSPQHLAATKQWHAEQLSNKVNKNMNNLYTLFTLLKKSI